MEKITAKPIIEDQFWILRKDNIKVGEMMHDVSSGYTVKLKGEVEVRFDSLDALKGTIEFKELRKPAATESDNVHGYYSEGTAYNAVWNVQYGLPLYTQTSDSKSWYAAGYYKVNISGTWIIQACPKLITLQRNKYKGPFKDSPSNNKFADLYE